jgi:hypothetical protein
MAYAFTDSRIMPKQAIASIVSTTAAVPVGTIVRAKDTTLGEGEFIYLPTTASVTLGNIVSYRQNASGTYTQSVPRAARLRRLARSCDGDRPGGVLRLVPDRRDRPGAENRRHRVVQQADVRQHHGGPGQAVASTGRGILSMVSGNTLGGGLGHFHGDCHVQPSRADLELTRRCSSATATSRSPHSSPSSATQGKVGCFPMCPRRAPRNLPTIGEQAIVCGGGPSLEDSLETIRQLKAGGAKIFALNNRASSSSARASSPITRS